MNKYKCEHELEEDKLIFEYHTDNNIKEYICKKCEVCNGIKMEKSQVIIKCKKCNLIIRF